MKLVIWNLRVQKLLWKSMVSTSFVLIIIYQHFYFYVCQI